MLFQEKQPESPKPLPEDIDGNPLDVQESEDEQIPIETGALRTVMMQYDSGSAEEEEEDIDGKIDLFLQSKLSIIFTFRNFVGILFFCEYKLTLYLFCRTRN